MKYFEKYASNTFAGMIGCDRKVSAKIAYFGDSITQGIGTKENSYRMKKDAEYGLMPYTNLLKKIMYCNRL